ncbi:acyl-CoA dehydrogenase [Lactobacillus delbrueckii]|nr:acyl-CoA dehydrogenase [Lactobacillus delbrueckii]MCT3491193.1 acyl-CoA dehydrogenase [Lactobacillus delbrueckii]
MLNIAGLALLVPFDLIFIGATIADYLRDRKFNSGKQKQDHGQDN